MQTDPTQNANAEILLRCAGLNKTYTQGRWFSRSRLTKHVLKGVSLSIRAHTTLALIGVSASGKSTLARCLTGIERPDSGEIWFEGKNLAALSRRERDALRGQIQIIFQEPAASLNPRFNGVEIVSEPLLIAGMNKKERHRQALDLMELVGVPANCAKRLPAELSGGQRRRLAIARALALAPKILILDESLAGLDLSIQAQISNLLITLQAARHLTYICISHDLDLVAHLADEVAVLHEGQIVEVGSPAELLAAGSASESMSRFQEASAKLNKLQVGLP
jgi:peptide/nickel transport system ATP-binding protein/oligopeptide transport system ATP-binding protein